MFTNRAVGVLETVGYNGRVVTDTQRVLILKAHLSVNIHKYITEINGINKTAVVGT